jgi:hypothetical protein
MHCMMRPFLILPVLAACTSTPDGDVVGPFTGPVHRYVVDRFDLPHATGEARAMGDDLNGDKTVDNQLGMVFGALAGEMDLTTHAADMLASGVLQTSIEIQADSLDDDATVGVRYLGAPNTPFTIMGGSIANGAFTSNRTETTMVPGEAELMLPVFSDADPAQIHAYALELSYTTDANGGLDIRVAGGIDPKTIVPAMVSGMQQMLAANPQAHMTFVRIFDTNHDWKVSTDEVANNSLFQALLWPDLQFFDANGRYHPGAYTDHNDTLSFGFTLHAIPCESGSCAGAIADTCHDRVLDGNETDVDCGGSCGQCAGDARCSVAADCQSQQCTGGVCAAPSCSDGLLDGFEADRDCGSVCSGCAGGRRCFSGFDCASGYCSREANYDASGVCAPMP